MINKLLVAIFFIMISVQSAFCDWHGGGHGGGGGGTPDPNLAALLTVVAIAILANVVMLICAGPFLIIYTHRMRAIMWIVPTTNLLLYLVSIFRRSYPGGFAAQFRLPGLGYTIAEIILVLVMSLIVTFILVAIKWIVRKIRSLWNKDKPITQ